MAAAFSAALRRAKRLGDINDDTLVVLATEPFFTFGLPTTCHSPSLPPASGSGGSDNPASGLNGSFGASPGCPLGPGSRLEGTEDLNVSEVYSSEVIITLNKNEAADEEEELEVEEDDDELLLLLLLLDEDDRSLLLSAGSDVAQVTTDPGLGSGTVVCGRRLDGVVFGFVLFPDWVSCDFFRCC